MVDAGFNAVFVGIETPSATSLRAAGKKQNLRLDQSEAVRTLTRAGLEVFAGFIVGFDGDDASIFERQAQFIGDLPIPRAMVGMLTALPGTALSRRLAREGRLRSEASGDQFDRPNFAPAMGETALVAGYRRLLAELYSEEGYFRRCLLLLETTPFRRSALRHGSVAALRRALWRLGLLGSRRRWFWRLVFLGLRRGGVTGLSKAVTLAILGEHLVRYTREEVLPRLDRLLGAAPPDEITRPWHAAAAWPLPPAEPPPASAATAGS
jgi:radical SAM superfamily enzyme YgiQ (UPF0313 family)